MDARVQDLDPRLYAQMPASLRKAAMGDLAKATATGVAALGLAKANGADVDLDPKSDRFGQFRLPGQHSWVDVWGGMTPYVRLMLQSAAGEHTTRSGYTRPTSLTDCLQHFGYWHLHPSAQAVLDAAAALQTMGKNQYVDANGKPYTIPVDASGQEYSAARQLKKHAAPIYLSEMYDAYEANGLPAALAIYALPAMAGVGVNSPRPSWLPRPTQPTQQGQFRLHEAH